MIFAGKGNISNKLLKRKKKYSLIVKSIVDLWIYTSGAAHVEAAAVINARVARLILVTHTHTHARAHTHTHTHTHTRVCLVSFPCNPVDEFEGNELALRGAGLYDVH